MPDRIEPALALLSHRVPTGPEGQYEIRSDGYRLAIHVELAGIRIITSGGDRWTDRFPSIAAAARDFSPSTVIFDGEAAVVCQRNAWHCVVTALLEVLPVGIFQP